VSLDAMIMFKSPDFSHEDTFVGFICESLNDSLLALANLLGGHQLRFLATAVLKSVHATESVGAH
jgi:hypothetical protein